MKTMHEFLDTLKSFPRYEQKQVWKHFRSGNVATAVAVLQEYLDERNMCMTRHTVNIFDQPGKPMQNETQLLTEADLMRYNKPAVPRMNLDIPVPPCAKPDEALQSGYYWVRDIKGKRVYIGEWSADANCWHWMGVSGTDKRDAVEVIGPVAELNQDQLVSIETALQRGYSATEFTLPYNWNMLDSRLRAMYVRWLQGQVA